MPIFMKAGSIEGDVAGAAHKGWVLVDSCSFSFEFDADEIRKSKEEGEREPDVGTFDVTKKTTDGSGPGFMNWIVSGDKLADVKIDVCSESVEDGEWRTQVQYMLKDVYLRDYSMNMDGEKGLPTVTMKMEYGELRVVVNSHDKGNERLHSCLPLKVKRAGRSG